jgi:hypothetical protein
VYIYMSPLLRVLSSFYVYVCIYTYIILFIITIFMDLYLLAQETQRSSYSFSVCHVLYFCAYVIRLATFWRNQICRSLNV